MKPVKRVLNEFSRVYGSLPDVDSDISSEGRDEIFKYIANKYPYVSKICTFTYLKARSSIKVAARILGIPVSIVDQLNKMIDPLNPLDFSLKKQEVVEFINVNKLQKVIDLADQFQGLVSQYGVHPAGVVISPDPLSQHIPIWKNERDDAMPISMFDLKGTEEAGLVKYDFLALLAVDIVNKAAKMCGVDIKSIPLDDPDTYKFFASGKDLYGIFQFEKPLTRQICQSSRPQSVLDLAAITSVIRPGALHAGFHEVYVKGGQQHALEVISEALRETRGVLLYQEQLMVIAQNMAGFNPSQADDLRSGIGKKKRELIDKYRDIFIKGCLDRGYLQEDAEQIYHWFETSADYAFNRSHAVSYALTSYRCAYLRTHFPELFFAAYLSAYVGNSEKLVAGIKRVKSAGFKFLLPDINKSQKYFSVEDGKIRIGLACIKGIGEVAYSNIKGTYVTLNDLRHCGLKKNEQEALIKSGACDSIIGSRNMAIHIINKDKSTLYDEEEAELIMPETDDDKGFMERDLLGIPVTKNPLASISAFRNNAVNSLSDLSIEHVGRKVSVVAVVRDVVYKTAKNEKKTQYINCVLEDPYEEMRGIIFSKAIPLVQEYLNRRDVPVIVTGYLDIDTFKNDEEEDVTENSDIFSKGQLKILSMEWAESQAKSVRLKVPSALHIKELENLKSFLLKNQVDNGYSVVIQYQDKQMKTPYKLNWVDWVEVTLNKKFAVVMEKI